ncbi:MAG: phage integrase SAM-like domain and Arm DNA-binding domain-containing protein, partial [Bacteroidota bacterium]|nr:phage integrase SAM-like domain and Arm DNA-binding domain-containing protein [Bacteroidota bacterium]
MLPRETKVQIKENVMNVQLRKKKLSNGKVSLYLDIYENGQRSYEFLKLYLVKPVTAIDRQHNKETLQLAETIKAKKQIQLQSNNYDFVPAFKRQTDFIEYFQHYIGKVNNKGIYRTTLFHFKAFSNKVAISAINERLINEFKAYLLQNIKKQNTAAKYFVTLKTVLNQAVKDKL